MTCPKKNGGFGWLTVFPHGQYINGIVVKCGFKIYLVTRQKLAFTRNLLKCNSDVRKKIMLRSNFAASRLSAMWHWHCGGDVSYLRLSDETCLQCAQLAHTAHESIVCREGLRRSSSQMTLRRTGYDYDL